MKKKISFTADEFSKLPAHVQALITHLGGDNYEMNFEGIEDVSALRSAKQHEVNERKIAQARVKQLEAEVAEHADTAKKYDDLLKSNVPKANVDALETSYKSKLDAMTKKHNDEKTALERSLKNVLVENVAGEMASRLSTVPSLMAKAIAERLTVDTDGDGNHITRVLQDGKVSALTLSDLEKEFVASKEFAPIIKATKGTGSGAPKSNPGGGATGDKKEVSLAKLDASSLVAHLEASGAVGADS